MATSMLEELKELQSQKVTRVKTASPHSNDKLVKHEKTAKRWLKLKTRLSVPLSFVVRVPRPSF
jgi:hypothetical protein